MSPFGNYRQAHPAAHCPSGRCAVCSSGLTQLRHEFNVVVRLSWSPAELALLSKAARSALL